MCSRRVLEQSEAKVTKLKEELVNTKEALNKASLEHEVLSHGRAELGTAVLEILVVTCHEQIITLAASSGKRTCIGLVSVRPSACLSVSCLFPNVNAFARV